MGKTRRKLSQESIDEKRAEKARLQKLTKHINRALFEHDTEELNRINEIIYQVLKEKK